MLQTTPISPQRSSARRPSSPTSARTTATRLASARRPSSRFGRPHRPRPALCRPSRQSLLQYHLSQPRRRPTRTSFRRRRLQLRHPRRLRPSSKKPSRRWRTLFWPARRPLLRQPSHQVLRSRKPSADTSVASGRLSPAAFILGRTRPSLWPLSGCMNCLLTRAEREQGRASTLL